MPLLNGRSLYWLAKAAGLPYWTVHKIANNKTKGISFIVLEKLCDALECEPCDLITKVAKDEKSLEKLFNKIK